MLGHQNIRFVGGIWNGVTKQVAPSTNEIGTSNKADEPPERGTFIPHPWRLTVSIEPKYTRRRLVLADDLRRYEESCFVLEGMSDDDARLELSKLVPSAPKASLVKVVPLPCRESSVIEGLAYDPKTRTLDVHFKMKPGETGKSSTYRYTGVSVPTVGELLTAESLGGFYVKYIRKQYPCVEL